YLPTLKTQTQIGSCYKYRCPCGFGPGPCQNPQCDLDAADQLEKAILEYGKENIMCFLAEPIVGAALGAATPGPDYWGRIREICTRYGVLMIVDEVMVGLGRTGTNFAIEHWSVDPDIIVLGKGLAAGYQPLGAVLASGKIIRAIQTGSGSFEHGFTYSGHPVAAAAGLAAITYLTEKRLVEDVQRRESEFFKAFEPFAEFDCVGDIRGRGFFMGIEFVKNKTTKEPFEKSVQLSRRICAAAEHAGLLVYPGSGFIDGERGDHILVAPPLIISRFEIEELTRRLTSALKRIHEELANPSIMRP
ncbi:MAG: aminotransferase class III-fold pyridoxal phosphate-dependent enzyme, partial [Candidatus Obscuribacterales bacterium]|nr:aminotransferase class III-fold pyridoxal phosphate-dependent enzyme [Candidatus Obscuribacterales bacterium]